MLQPVEQGRTHAFSSSSFFSSRFFMKQQVDGDLSFRCAAGLSQVCSTPAGEKFWYPSIQKVFFTLANDVTWRVRRTIASNLDILAEHLPKHIIQADLAPIFIQYLNDTDEVKLAVLRIFASFFKQLGHGQKLAILPMIKEFKYTENVNYRSGCIFFRFIDFAQRTSGWTVLGVH